MGLYIYTVLVRYMALNWVDNDLTMGSTINERDDAWLGLVDMKRLILLLTTAENGLRVVYHDR